MSTKRYRNRDNVVIHTSEDFIGMRKAGELAARTLDYIAPHIVAGISTEQINTLCHEFIIQHGAIPAPLGYRGFPKSVCTSVNHVVCHGIPSTQKQLQNGDIINVDVTVILDGWYGDTSRTFAVGRVGVQARRLIDSTYQAMMEGIKIVRPGITFGDIGYAIQTYAESQGFSVVRDFCGHGLGRVFHDYPDVLHYATSGAKIVLETGMFFTIEPMLNVGSYEVKVLSDNWTAVTRDRSLSAQFEHSLGVTDDGYEIFTLSSADTAMDMPS